MHSSQRAGSQVSRDAGVLKETGQPVLGELSAAEGSREVTPRVKVRFARDAQDAVDTGRFKNHLRSAPGFAAAVAAASASRRVTGWAVSTPPG